MTKRHLVKRILSSVYCLNRSFRRTRNPRVMMTLLVKDEADIIESNLLFHKQMGVDGFIVTDNGSTDGTLDIIEKYSRMGWIKEVIKESSVGYEQKQWVDRMIWRAKTVYYADWVVNADADEFWYVPSGGFKTVLSKTSANVLLCEMRNMYPEENVPFWEWRRAVRVVEHPENYNLSQYSLFEHLNNKVIHRTDGYLQISMGNHKVCMFPYFACNADIRVYHYCNRGFDYFMRKMINGGEQLEQHKGRHGGRHWRYFYRLYQDGRLNDEYARVIGLDRYEDLFRAGYVFEDGTMCEFFKEKMGKTE